MRIKTFQIVLLLLLMFQSGSSEEGESAFRYSYESGNYTGAIEQLSRMLDSEPDNPNFWYYLARSYQHMLHFNDARNAFNTVLNLDSTYLPAYFHLSRIYTETGEFDKAIGLLQFGLGIDDENTTLLYLLAGVFSANERYEDALGIINQGLQLDPEDRRFLRRYADLNFRLNRFESSARTYRTIIDKGDSSAIVFRNCGISYYFLENYPDALRYLSTAYYLDQSDANAVLYFGLAHRAIGNIRYSIGILNDAVTLLSKGMLSDAILHLAKAYEATQDITEAVKQYRLIPALNSERPEAYYYLASLFDDHYEDRETPKKYYKKFLEESGGRFPELEAYARHRILLITEELFFTD